MHRATAVFGTWNGSSADVAASDFTDPITNATTIYLVDRPGAPQSVIRAVHSLVPRLHPDYFPLLLANYSFGGQFSARLNQNLRQDKGYSYGYMSSIQWLRRPSLLVAGGSVQSNATGESVYETLKEFREVVGRSSDHSRGTGQRQGRPAARLPRQLRAPRLGAGTAGRHGAIRPPG